MKKSMGLVAVTSVFLLVNAFGLDTAWKKYANARFGFVLTYPSTLIASPEAMNGDGREFHNANREFSLAASGHFFVPGSGDSFEQRWQEELNTPDVSIVYKKKSANWYVVSGTTRSGTDYYHKLYRNGANWAAFQITYPHLKSQHYEAWVSRIEKSFIAFRGGNYDRIQ
jgi:hypothetical protein